MTSPKSNKPKQKPKAFPDFLSFFLIGSCLLIIPFLFSRRLLDPAMSLRFTALAVSLFIIVLLITGYRKSASPDFSILKHKVFPVYIFYIVISAISLIAAINIWEGIFELLKIALILVFIGTSCVILLNTPNSIPRLIKAVIITSLVSAIIGICQYYDIAFNSLPGHFVIYGTMINKNFFSSFLFLLLPFSLYGYFILKDMWDIPGGLASVLSLWCIVLAASRAVWLALLVSSIGVGLVWIILFNKNIISRINPKPMMVRIAILMIAFIALSSYSYFQVAGPGTTESPLQKKITAGSGAGGPETVKIRLKLWEKTLRMIADHPFIGLGLGNWKINVPIYGTNRLPSAEGKVHYLRPHNDFLGIFAETGPLGFIAYLSIFFISLFYLFKTLIHSKIWKNEFLLLMMLFGVIGFGIISSFSFPKERIAHLIFGNLPFVIILIKYHQQFKPSENRKSATKNISQEMRPDLSVPMLPMLIISAVILFISVLFGYQMVRSNIHQKILYARWDRKQWKQMIDEVNKAQTPFINLDHNAAPFEWLKGIAYISLDQKQKALEALKKAAIDHPYHIQVLDNLATCYELLGDHENAVKYYERVREISPHFENVLRNLSVIYYNMGEYQKAIQTYSQIDIYSKNETVFKYLEIYKRKLDESE